MRGVPLGARRVVEGTRGTTPGVQAGRRVAGRGKCRQRRPLSARQAAWRGYARRAASRAGWSAAASRRSAPTRYTSEAKAGGKSSGSFAQSSPSAVAQAASASVTSRSTKGCWPSQRATSAPAGRSAVASTSLASGSPSWANRRAKRAGAMRGASPGKGPSRSKAGATRVTPSAGQRAATRSRVCTTAGRPSSGCRQGSGAPFQERELACTRKRASGTLRAVLTTRLPACSRARPAPRPPPLRRRAVGRGRRLRASPRRTAAKVARRIGRERREREPRSERGCVDGKPERRCDPLHGAGRVTCQVLEAHEQEALAVLQVRTHVLGPAPSVAREERQVGVDRGRRRVPVLGVQAPDLRTHHVMGERVEDVAPVAGDVDAVRDRVELGTGRYLARVVRPEQGRAREQESGVDGQPAAVRVRELEERSPARKRDGVDLGGLREEQLLGTQRRGDVGQPGAPLEGLAQAVTIEQRGQQTVDAIVARLRESALEYPRRPRPGGHGRHSTAHATFGSNGNLRSRSRRRSNRSSSASVSPGQYALLTSSKAITAPFGMRGSRCSSAARVGS